MSEKQFKVFRDPTWPEFPWWRDFGSLRVVIYGKHWRPRIQWWHERPQWELIFGWVELRWRVHRNKP